MNRRQFMASAGAAGLLSSGLALPAFAGNPGKSIAQLAAATPQLSTLLTAVKAAGLAEVLSGAGNFTVFAPTNDAFAALPAGTVEALLADKEALTRILTYHVSPDYYPARALLGNRGRVPTVQGGFLRVDAQGEAVHINGGTRVIAADIMASNGIVHLIDKVLLPH